ncbi:SNF1-related protein kinase regulatory subunit gamma-1-like protein [Tanacetum coccineum]
MLSVLLLLSKYRLRNVLVIEPGNPLIKNFITQSIIVQGLEQCKGIDWFDAIFVCPITKLGLPFVSKDKVRDLGRKLFSSQSDELILEAFKKMKDYQIGGLPVVEGPLKKIVGNLTMKDFLNTIAATLEENMKVVSPITCKVRSTLGDVISTLSPDYIHRIYVVGDSNDVIDIITLRDFLLYHQTFKLLNGGPWI